MRMPVVRISGRNTDFSSVESLGEALGRVAFDAAQPGHRLKRIASEPGALRLAGKGFGHDFALALQLRPREGNEDVRNAEVAVEFWDLVFEYQVVPEGVPRELVRNPVVLVQVLAQVGEHHVGPK